MKGLFMKSCLLVLFAVRVASQPSNDLCTRSIALAINGPVVAGTTTDAEQDTSAPSPEVYYSVVGNGRIMRVSTCGAGTAFPTSMYVQNGGCSSRAIGGTSNAAPECPTNVNAASITWDSTAGRTYPIVVHGRQAGAMGDFTISAVDFVNPDNDYCGQAQALPINGPAVTGTTINATKATNAPSPEVYYSVVGNGRIMRVSTCGAGTAFPTSMYLQNGGCSSGAIVRIRSNAAPECPTNVNAASITWDSTAGRTYDVVVHGRQAGAMGDFTISAVDFVNPDNDYCTQTQPLAINGPAVTGTTINATKATSASSPEVYYSVVGNGGELTVSTCSDMTTFETSMYVQNGGCSSGAIGGTSNAAPECPTNVNAASITWESVADRTYPVVVYGRQSGAMGDFAVSVRDVNSTIAPAGAPAPAASPTVAPVVAPTDAPIPAPTDAPVPAPTDTPSAAPVEDSTEPPSVSPVEDSTETPTAAPVEDSTEAPSASPVESAAPGSYWVMAITVSMISAMVCL